MSSRPAEGGDGAPALDWLDALVETSPTAIGVISVHQNRYVRANAAMVELYGMSLEELLAADPFTLAVRLTHPDDLDAEQSLFADLVAGTRRYYRIEKRYVRRDGTVRWGLLTFSGLFGHAEGATRGILVGAVLNVVDIGERKTLEETLRRRDAELRHAQKVDALGRLAAGVAHDFNNLLTVITGHGEVLRQQMSRPDADPSAPELGDDLAAILSAAERAAGLTAQLLAYGRRELSAPRTFVLSQLAATLQHLLRRTLGSDVEIEQALDAAGAIFADQGQVGQVIMNLMLNARDALGEGGRIRLETRDVVIRDATSGGPGPGEWVALIVSDNGHGMSPDVKARMFEPFFTTRADRPGVQGTGLGLATVQRIASDAGAHIAVESAPGRGTTMSLFFPKAEEAPLDVESLPARRGGPMPLSRRVLVIEDEPQVRTLVGTVLLGAHYWVSVARDGIEGMAAIESEAEPYDLVVTDLMMPRIGELALARRLHESGGKPRMLFISGYAHDAPAELAPYGKLLSKPFTPAQLLAAVADALGEEVS